MRDASENCAHLVRCADLLDTAWVSAVRGLPRERRLALLARADLERGQGAEGEERAHACYFALGLDLDPSLASDRSRLQALFDGGCGAHASLQPLWSRVRDGADPALAAQAADRLGSLAQMEGRPEEAERHYRWALGRALPLGGRVAGDVLSSCASFAIDAGRELEALAYVRRAATFLGQAGGPRWHLAVLTWIEARVYTLLEDWPLQRETTARFTADVERCGSVQRRRARPELADLAAQRALALGDGEAALEALTEHEAGLAPFPLFLQARGPALLADRVRALVLAERSGEALQRARDSMWRLAPGDPAGIPLRLATLQARRASGEACAALEPEARALLDLLSRDEASALSPTLRRVLATRLAGLLAASSSCAQAVRAAYDLAATLSLERLLEVERFSRDLPDLAQLAEADLAVFNGQRRRLEERHRALPKAVARHLMRALSAGHPIADHLPCEDGHVPVCAWCLRLRIRGQRWLTVQQFFPLAPATGLRVTHCVCERCADGLRREMRTLAPLPD